MVFWFLTVAFSYVRNEKILNRMASVDAVHPQAPVVKSVASDLDEMDRDNLRKLFVRLWKESIGKSFIDIHELLLIQLHSEKVLDTKSAQWEFQRGSMPWTLWIEVAVKHRMTACGWPHNVVQSIGPGFSPGAIIKEKWIALIHCLHAGTLYVTKWSSGMFACTFTTNSLYSLRSFIHFRGGRSIWGHSCCYC